MDTGDRVRIKPRPSTRARGRHQASPALGTVEAVETTGIASVRWDKTGLKAAHRADDLEVVPQ